MSDKHVVTLDVAKRLKEYLPKEFKSKLSMSFPVQPYVTVFDSVYTPNTDEMLELLPVVIMLGGEEAEIKLVRVWTNERNKDGVISPYYAQYEVGYNSLNYDSIDEETCFFSKINFATALAELYMWLVDNKYIKVKNNG